MTSMIDEFEARWRELIALGEMATREVDAEQSDPDGLRGRFTLQAALLRCGLEKPGLPELVRSGDS